MRFILMALLLVGCAANTKKNHEMDRRNMNEYMEISETHSYFLPDIPNWANFSVSGKCRRQKDVRFLNLEKISQSFNFDYKKTLQFQLLYNKELTKFKKETGIRFLPFKNEDELFYLVTNKIQAGFVPLKVPRFPRVNLVWIDPIINGPKTLEKFLKGPEMEKGPPVLVSLCLSDDEFKKYQAKIKFSDVNMAIISMEMFTIFNSSLKSGNYFQINFDQMFNKDQKLYLYIPKGTSLPEEFRGNFNVQFF